MSLPTELGQYIGKARERVVKAGHDLIWGSNTPDRYGPILPYPVREALSDEACIFDRDLVEATTYTPAFVPTAFYLAVKMLNSQKEAQREALLQASEASSEPESYLRRLRRITTDILDEMDPEATVIGTKCAQVSRVGPDTWENAFRRIAESDELRNWEITPTLIAYSTITGIRPFFENSRAHQKPFLLLVPDWINDPTDPDCGYTIDSSKGSVEILPKDFDRPRGVKFVDDTLHTGKHMLQIQRFWYQNPRMQLQDLNLADSMLACRLIDPDPKRVAVA